MGDAMGTQGITLRNVYGVRGLDDAVQGTHPAIFAAAAKKAEDARFQSLTDDDLEDFVIAIPNYPDILDELLWHHCYGHKRDHAIVKQGAFVRKGQVIDKIGPNILSPVDGKIYEKGACFSASGLDWPDGAYWPQSNSSDEDAKRQKYKTMRFLVQPVKGCLSLHPVADAYKELFELIEQFLEHKFYKDYRKRAHINSAYEAKIRKVIADMRAAPAHIERLDSPGILLNKYDQGPDVSPSAE